MGVLRGLGISPTAAFWLVVLLLFGSSAYFTFQVEARRATWKAKKSTAKLANGEKVQLVTVVDGDEVSVKRGDDVFVIRLLGIKSFDAKVSEPGISEYGAACHAALEGILKRATSISVEFENFTKDRHNRVLAYLRVNERDAGHYLVSQGHSLVLLSYPFSREDKYRAAQQVARTRGRGLWSSPKARERADALEKKWQAKRAQN